MGLEIGWYLRLSKAPRLEVLLQPDAVSIAREQFSFVNGWKMDEVPQDDHTMVVYERLPRTNLT